MKVENTSRAALILALGCSSWAAPPSSVPINYQLRSLTVCPGCPTATAGINDKGLVTASGPGQGYVYDIRTNIATPVPGALNTTVPSDNGAVPGITITPAGIVPWYGVMSW